VDRLIHLREPATVVALLGLGLHLVLTLAYLLVAPTSDDVLLADLAVGLSNPLLLALPAGLAVTCWMADVTPRASGLTLCGLLLTAAVLAVTAGLLIAGVVRAPVDAAAGLLSILLRGIPGLTVGVIALTVFITLLQRPSVVTAPAAEVAEPPRVSAAPPADPQLQPGWSPDTAVGAVWRRAGDAAAGAPATGWDTTPETTGWGPIPTTDGPPQASSEQS
jgi:hypothetical protein